jgi:molybdenum cofactor cytidylyltransferase
MGMVGVLLAAGGASRFRSSAEKHGLSVAHKLMAPLRGDTVFSWSLRNLLDAVPQTDITEVIVVQGALDLSGLVETVVGWRNLRVHLVTNPNWAQGQATSLALAIDTIKASLNISNELTDVAIDASNVRSTKGSNVGTKPSMPGRHAMVVGLGDQPFLPAETWAAVANAPVAQQIVVATYGGLRRNPVRIDRQWWGEIPRTGDEGARPLLRNRAEFVHELPCNGDPADIDTVEDLLRWS